MTTERAEHIETLREMVHIMTANGAVYCPAARITALNYAIAALLTEAVPSATVAAARETALKAFDEGDLTPTEILDTFIAAVEVEHTRTLLRTTEKSFRAGEAHATKARP